MKNSHNINQLFTDWGKKEQVLPLHSQEMKAKALAAFETARPNFAKASLDTGTPWFSLAFAALAALIFLTNGTGVKTSAPTASAPATAGKPADSVSVNYAVTESTAKMVAPLAGRGMPAQTTMGTTAGTVAYRSEMAEPDYYPRPTYKDTTPPVSDTREFLKTDYNATIRTQNVPDLTRRVETTIRGFGGRVDSVSNSEEWGSVGFVVPTEKFDSFRIEIESIAGSRFITTQLNSENLLAQKQRLEELRKIADKDLNLYVDQQEKNLLDTVGTVRGTISFQKIGMWDVVLAYVSASWMFAILIGIAFISYLFERRKAQTTLF